MAKYESSIKQVPFAQSSVYAKLSDLNSMSSVKERLNDPTSVERMKGNVSEEQFQKAQEQLESLEFTEDTVSMDIPPVGKMTIRIIEREPEKCVKFEAVEAPVPMTLWIQMLPTSETSSKMKLTIDANLNPFIKVMVEKPLKEGIEKLADLLAMIPYE